MKHYESSAVIDASAAAIWAILVDAPRLSNWDSGIERVEGKIEHGQTIKVYSKINPKQAFPVKVADFKPSERMVWSGGMPFGLFKGVRTFTLTPQGNSTKFTMREEFTGPMLPMIWGSMPDLGPSFEQFAKGLKTEAERNGK